MRIWLSGPRIGIFRPGVGFRLGASSARRRRPVRHDATSAARGGFVYVIQREGDHRVKIGSSRNPDQRRAELQTGSPDILSIAYRVPVLGSAEAVERKAHDLLDRHRGSGEWFAVPVDVAVAAIHASIFQAGQQVRDGDEGREPRISLAAFLIVALVICIGLYAMTHSAQSAEKPPWMDFQAYCRDASNRETTAPPQDVFLYCMQTEYKAYASLAHSYDQAPTDERRACESRLKAIGSSSYHLLKICIDEHWKVK